MNLADVFAITFSVLGFLIVFVAYWLLAAGLFPRMVARCAEKLGEAPVSSVVVGAVTFLPLLIGGLIGSSKAPNAAGKIIFVAIALIVWLAALLGSAGLALRIGRGLAGPQNAEASWTLMRRGGVVLGLTFVLPFLGTFVVMPLSFMAGFGALLLTSFGRKRHAQTSSTDSLERTSEAAPPPLAP